MLILDKFLPKDIYTKLKEYSLNCLFEGVVNPIDGVVYPDINRDIPQSIKEKVLNNINLTLGCAISSPITFLRMSKEGTHCPNTFHTDNSHGTHSLMLYLNDNKEGGTGLAQHISTGLISAPTNNKDLQELIKDSNSVSEWELLYKSPMRENTAVIFDASWLHCALPIGGFGDTQEDARIVLTVFFTIDEKI